MRRIFSEHEIRKCTELDGIWGFELLEPQNREQEAVRSMPVPGCVENHPACIRYRGKMRYYKSVWAGGNIRLWFGGISHTARVYFDGQPVGEHYNAYTGFEIVLRDVRRGEHLIEVEADNSFSEESALHVPNDYYTYGGMIRPVCLEQLSGCYIKGVKIDTIRQEEGWKARVRLTVRNLQRMERKIRIQGWMEENCVHESTWIGLPAEGETEYIWESLLEHVEPYSMKNPRLYQWHMKLQNEEGEWIDDLTERTGFREIRIEGNQILMNGERILIKGVNRHEEYGDLGCCIPVNIMYRDIMLMKDLGVNFVRTSHYQNDDRFLDLCDENGILVWEEGHARGLSEEQMKNPHFMEQSRTGIAEMIESHYNHPSVLMWGILNECASHTPYGRDCYQKLFAQIRELDGTRPVTFASCHPQDDLCLDLPDIVSFNIYPLWYTEEGPKEYLEKLHRFIDGQGQGEKPLIISETGAGAVYGFRSMGREKWSEERQEDILRAQLEAVLADQRCCGVCIWQFADCRVSEEWFAVRPKSRNNKGILDQYRRPKLAYQAVKELYKAEKE